MSGFVCETCGYDGGSHAEGCREFQPSPQAPVLAQDVSLCSAFEKWVKSRGGSVMCRDGIYIESMTRLWWECWWQASQVASRSPAPATTGEVPAMSLHEACKLAKAEEKTKELLNALEPFTRLGGPNDGVMPAFHDLPDDVVVYENSGQGITAGEVRQARNVFGLLHAPWPIVASHAPATTGDGAGLADYLLKLAEREDELSHDCDCRPEDTANFEYAKRLREAAAYIRAAEAQSPAGNYDQILTSWAECRQLLSDERKEAERLRAQVEGMRECLQSIADMKEDEPREPDDADWRWRALECKRCATVTLTSTDGKPAT